MVWYEKIKDVKDFPKKGVVFKDIAPLLASPKDFQKVIHLLCEHCLSKNKPDKIVAIDARGFIFASAVAYELNIPLVLIRKKGKLPGNIKKVEYNLEYGTDQIEIQEDAIQKNDNVIIIDDLMATGGTGLAACILIESLGGNVTSFMCPIDLIFLGGSKMLQNSYDVVTLYKVEE